MLDIRRRSQATFILITHDFSLAWAVGDRIAVMYSGKIVEMGPTFDVIREPKHPYTRALVSVVPVPDPTLQRKRIYSEVRCRTLLTYQRVAGFIQDVQSRKERCKAEEPEIQNVTAAHEVACHFWQEPFP